MKEKHGTLIEPVRFSIPLLLGDYKIKARANSQETPVIISYTLMLY